MIYGGTGLVIKVNLYLGTDADSFFSPQESIALGNPDASAFPPITQRIPYRSSPPLVATAQSAQIELIAAIQKDQSTPGLVAGSIHEKIHGAAEVRQPGQKWRQGSFSRSHEIIPMNRDDGCCTDLLYSFAEIGDLVAPLLSAQSADAKEYDFGVVHWGIKGYLRKARTGVNQDPLGAIFDKDRKATAFVVIARPEWRLTVFVNIGIVPACQKLQEPRGRGVF